MKALILAAGYATRLYPLTENFPKPLIKVGGRSILDRLLEQLTPISELDSILLVTNHRYFSHFSDWRASYQGRFKVELLDDGSTSNENRLGAIADTALAIAHWQVDDQLLVCAADNILRFSIADYVRAAKSKDSAWICVRHIEDLTVRQRTGMALVDDSWRVISFEEKPREPKSCWGAPPFYIYPRAILPLVQEYLAAGGNPDAPGNFMAWLHKKVPVYAHPVTGDVLDIGSPDSLKRAETELMQKAAVGGE